jgi:hypothetical protein
MSIKKLLLTNSSIGIYYLKLNIYINTNLFKLVFLYEINNIEKYKLLYIISYLLYNRFLIKIDPK